MRRAVDFLVLLMMAVGCSRYPLPTGKYPQENLEVRFPATELALFQKVPVVLAADNNHNHNM